jgi:hypothetical protein
VSTNPEGGQHGIDRLVVLGYVIALGMPPIGLIVGIIGVLRRQKRGRSRHLVGIIAVSIASGAIWAVIIASGALTATNMSY